MNTLLLTSIPVSCLLCFFRYQFVQIVPFLPILSALCQVRKQRVFIWNESSLCLDDCALPDTCTGVYGLFKSINVSVRRSFNPEPDLKSDFCDFLSSSSPLRSTTAAISAGVTRRTSSPRGRRRTCSPRGRRRTCSPGSEASWLPALPPPPGPTVETTTGTPGLESPPFSSLPPISPTPRLECRRSP